MDPNMTMSLMKIAHEYKQGRLGAMADGVGCQYFDPFTHKHCAVGCLIPDEMGRDADQDALAVSDLYEMAKNDYSRHLGKELGLSVDQAQVIQFWHDAAFLHNGIEPEDFLLMIEGLLDGTITEVSLKPRYYCEGTHPTRVSFAEVTA